jgi:hypothetical protein
MDLGEINAVTGDLASYGVAGQGYDDIDVEYGRRIRLLAFVDASFYTPLRPAGRQALPHLHRRSPVVLRQHPVHDRLPVPHRHSRYIALIADGRYADSYELNKEHNVFPGCLGRMCARPCEDACRRKEIDAPIGICYLKRVAADFGARPVGRRRRRRTASPLRSSAPAPTA